MALIGNYSLLHKSPAKYTTGTVGYGDRANWSKPKMLRSRGNSVAWRLTALPTGFVAGKAFLAPVTAGAMATRSSVRVSGVANGAMGMPGQASGLIEITAESIGGLIAGGVAVGTISITGSADIAGLASGAAAGTMTFSGLAGLGAIAWGIANGTVTITGAVQPFGYAYGSASTVDTGLTVTGITNAVWNAMLSNYQVPGSAGKALFAASSGGVDYEALGLAVWNSVSRTLTAGAAPTVNEISAAVLASMQAAQIPVNLKAVNDVPLKGDGTAGNPWNPA